MEEKHTPSEIQEALDVLRGGRERLLSGNWCNHAPHSDDENCAASALKMGDEGFRVWDRAFDALSSAADRLFPERTGTSCIRVAQVNDHPDTTFNDVLSIYDEAERLLKERL